jgi:hypothetical protein
MLDFILSTQNGTAFTLPTQNETDFTLPTQNEPTSTSITPSISTEIPNGTNRFDSMSIIAFVFIYVLHCLLIHY